MPFALVSVYSAHSSSGQPNLYFHAFPPSALCARSAAVAILLEVEPKVQDPAIEHALVSHPVAVVPGAVQDLKRNVLIRRAGMESDDHCVRVVRLLDMECRRLRFVDEIWIKDVELVSLHDLGWRVILVIVSLVVLIPVVSRSNTVEVLRLPRPKLVVRTVLAFDDEVIRRKQFLVPLSRFRKRSRNIRELPRSQLS